MEQVIKPKSMAVNRESSIRRVRRADAKPISWAQPEGLEYCLDCWKSWMRKTDTDLGAQSCRSLRGDGDGYGNNETMEARRDNEIAGATDAMINSLIVSQRWAIYRKCGISTVWRFPSLDFIDVADSASIELEKKLRNNVATRLLFG